MDLLRQNVSDLLHRPAARRGVDLQVDPADLGGIGDTRLAADEPIRIEDRKSTRLNSSH